MTWPTLRHPMSTIPNDTSDPTLQAWQVAWNGHALAHNLLGIWNTNASYPERYTLAYSDSLLGYAPFALFGSGPVAAVFRYNILYVFTFALAMFGVYALLRQLGATVIGATVAGIAFAYSPWRFSHAGHLNILSDGGIALALAMLARGHGWSLTGGYSPDRVRPSWALAGWLVAAWQVSLGFGLGLPFSYILILIIALSGIGWLRRRPRLPRRLIGADVIGGLLFSCLTLVMMYPYLQVLRLHPDSRRTAAWLDVLSPPFRGLFISDQQSWLWGVRQTATRQTLTWPPEMTLLPGFALIALAALGLLGSIWSLRTRLLLAFGVVISAWLAMGTAAPGHGKYGYLLLFNLLPGFDGSRTPGRLVLWTILLLAVLAAGAVSSAQIGLRRSPILLRGLIILPLVAVLAEGINHPEHPEVPLAPIALSQFADPIMVLPTDEAFDLNVMLWSTAGFPRMVNGSSGYIPPEQAQLRDTMKSFPDLNSVLALRAIGVKTVVVLRDQAANSPYLTAMITSGAGLGITRTDLKDAVVFTL
jgi:hypothetical protein